MAAPVGAASAKSGAASGTLRKCAIAHDATGGAAVFVGAMAQVPNGVLMQMRFELLRGQGTDGWQRVALPTWSGWLSSTAHRPAFVYNKRVEGLTGPASYRARISFRWLGAKGKVLRHVQRITPACAEPDVRADLIPGRNVNHKGAGAGQVSYLVPIRNIGGSAAAPSSVVLTVNGVPLSPVAVAGLPARGRQVVAVVGPRCTPGSMLVVTADSGAAVAEADEANNMATIACPLKA